MNPDNPNFRSEKEDELRTENMLLRAKLQIAQEGIKQALVVKYWMTYEILDATLDKIKEVK